MKVTFKDGSVVEYPTANDKSHNQEGEIVIGIRDTISGVWVCDIAWVPANSVVEHL